MKNNRLNLARHFTACCVCSLLITLSACVYQKPPGRWATINASTLYFSGVKLSDRAITSAYRDTCIEAQQEIEKELINRLPAQIKPLLLYAAKKPPAADSKTAELKLLMTQCDINVDQSGDNFTYYLSLSLRVTLMEDDQSLLNYPVKIDEQLQTDVPSPIFEFSFADAVSRTLLLFKGKQIWLVDKSLPE